MLSSLHHYPMPRLRNEGSISSLPAAAAASDCPVAARAWGMGTEEESSEMGRVRVVNTGQHGDLFCLYTHGQLGHFPCPTPHGRPPKRGKTSGEATEWLGRKKFPNPGTAVIDPTL